MQTTAIYEKIIRSPEKLTWLEILKGAPEKHSQRDVDYAMIAGTTLDTVQNETGMLQKWQYPWLYRSVLKAGVVGMLMVLAAIGTVILLDGVCYNACLNLLLIVFGPCVIPVALMVFFWEMNAPRNISLAQLLGYFFTGGVLSLLVTLLLDEVIMTSAAYMAPLVEEPAKLLISMFFLSRLSKKHGRVYGLNGLTIGAAVGAGFAAFESAQYAFTVYNLTLFLNENSYLVEYLRMGALPFNMSIMLSVLDNVLMRNVFSVGMHVLYCAPYACIVALYMEKTDSPFSALSHMDFWAVFAVSFIAHMVWNMADFGVAGTIGLFAVKASVLWISAQYGMRKSFASIAAGVSGGGSGALSGLRIQGIRGIHTGVAFALTHQSVLIGSNDCCQLVYPVATPGIDGQHAKLVVQNGNVYLADAGSIAGTYLNGIRLQQGKGYLLKPGDEFSLGGPEQSFRVI